MNEKDLLVTMSERNWIKENAIQEVGESFKYHVIDIKKASKHVMDERKRKMMSDVIEIRPIYPDLNKAPSRTGTFQKDPITNVYYGILISVNEYGNMKWHKTQIHDYFLLDLNKELDLNIWTILRFNPNIKGSPFQGDNPYYYVYDPVDEALSEMKRAEMIEKAFAKISTIKSRPQEMLMFARYMGEDFNQSVNTQVVLGKLFKLATDYPEEIIKKWDSNDRGAAEKLRSAMSLGIVTSDIDRGLMFRNVPLGLDEEQAIRTLKKDQNITSSINIEIQQKDILMKKMIEEGKVNSANKKENEKENKKPVGKKDVDFE